MAFSELADWWDQQTEVLAYRPDGTQIGSVISTNQIDCRTRAVAEIDTAKHPDFVLRVGNNIGIVDYWLGVFPASGAIVKPYFVRTPKIEPFELGKPVSATLDPKRGPPAEAWYFGQPEGRGLQRLRRLHAHRWPENERPGRRGDVRTTRPAVD